MTEIHDGEEPRHASPRIAGFEALEATPRRAAMRRLAKEMRDVIEHLVSTTATTRELEQAADELEVIAAGFRRLPRGQTYEGFAEAANAGPEPFDDAERFAFFDHSPFIGAANPMAPPMRLRHEGQRVVGEVTFGSAYEGPPGCVHGGYVAGAFDELLGAAQSLSGVQGMTARLITNYRRPTPLHTPLMLEGRVDRIEGRKIFAVGTMRDADMLTAEAEGLFVVMNSETFGAMVAARNAKEG
ncbi:MAG: PaaI family thioesterase [Actinobacteria bacterium]|nr:MAG: PaaI family thioesterase [Actinomycetota bacterium]RIK08413.1 MAG: hypothetical protein DCC48_00225 [Acidobacteriota bacterium]